MFKQTNNTTVLGTTTGIEVVVWVRKWIGGVRWVSRKLQNQICSLWKQFRFIWEQVCIRKLFV